MSHVEMASNARNISAIVHPENREGQFGMASLASALGYAMVIALDQDVVGISAGCEREGMEESIRRFDGVLAQEIMWRMAIVTVGHRPVTAFDPTGVVLLHYVAVGAGFRIIGEVRVSLCVHEGVQPQADNYTDKDAENNGACSGSHDAFTLARFAVDDLNEGQSLRAVTGCNQGKSDAQPVDLSLGPRHQAGRL